MLIFIINILNIIFPKNKNKSVFIGYPDFDDQLRGLLPYINTNLIILSNSEKKPEWLKKEAKCNYSIVKKNSFFGVYHLITSSRVYFTHGIFCGMSKINKRRQCIINLWHGMPIKKIGYLDGKESFPECHFTLTTSPFFIGILSKSFGINADEILLSGLPRNNILLSRCDRLFSDYGKVYVWLPTYRQSNKGDIRKDSDSEYLLGSNNYCLSKIDQFLGENNSLLIIKPHPMAVFNKIENKYNNIIIIDEDFLFKNGISLYQLLSMSSCLITDFSSVAIDYAVTGKPIIFTISDIESYHSNRGFSFDVSLIVNEFNSAFCTTELIDLMSNSDRYFDYKYSDVFKNQVYGFDFNIVDKKING